jgi:hypothetical protein
MATNAQTALVGSAPSTTQLEKRTVADQIRYLAPADSVLSKLIAIGSSVDGVKVKSEGMISKKPATSQRIEGYYQTPIEIINTVTVASSLDLTFADVTFMHLRQVWTNTANATVGRISAINTSTKVVSFITVGSTTFSAVEGDVILNLGNAYKENSTAPAYIRRSEDNYYNTMQIFRFPIEISGSYKAEEHIAGGDYWKRVKEITFHEGMRAVERALLFGERSASNNVTADGTLSESFSTLKGLWGWAGGAYDAGGNMTPEKFQIDFANQIHESVGESNKPLLMLTSKENYGRMLGWVNDKIVQYTEKSSLEKFGIKTLRFMTQRRDVEVCVHNAFNQGANVNKAVVFDPEMLTYYYKKGRDFKLMNNIQPNDQDGFKDEIRGECSLLPDDGGFSITKITNFF